MPNNTQNSAAVQGFLDRGAAELTALAANDNRQGMMGRFAA